VLEELGNYFVLALWALKLYNRSEGASLRVGQLVLEKFDEYVLYKGSRVEYIVDIYLSYIFNLYILRGATKIVNYISNVFTIRVYVI
jgi:hypothetical protein